MSEQKLSPEDEQALERYNRLLAPDTSDPTLSLLKAHLLIEEALFEYIATRVKHRNHLESAKLTFSQTYAIARALSFYPDDWVWKGVKDLNRLRNRLAHHPEVVGFDESIEDLSTFVIASVGIPNSPATFDPLTAKGLRPEVRRQQLLARLTFALAMLYGVFRDRLVYGRA